MLSDGESATLLVRCTKRVVVEMEFPKESNGRSDIELPAL